MNLRSPGEAAAEFLILVQKECFDSLATELLILHQPVMTGDRPGCQGCDQTNEATYDPIWPCRTFELIAATTLRNVAPDREFQLLGYLASLERQHTRSRIIIPNLDGVRFDHQSALHP